jgi:hypothetical protein
MDLIMTMVIAFSAVMAPVFVLKMPNLMNPDGTVNKWAGTIKFGLAILVAFSMYNAFPYALQWIHSQH